MGAAIATCPMDLPTKRHRRCRLLAILFLFSGRWSGAAVGDTAAGGGVCGRSSSSSFLPGVSVLPAVQDNRPRTEAGTAPRRVHRHRIRAVRPRPTTRRRVHRDRQSRRAVRLARRVRCESARARNPVRRRQMAPRPNPSRISCNCLRCPRSRGRSSFSGRRFL